MSLAVDGMGFGPTTIDENGKIGEAVAGLCQFVP